MVRTGEPMTFETEFRGRQMYISVVRPSDGKFATIFDDITERKRAEQQVQHLAYSDTLTGLPNRALLMHQLRDALARCERDGTQLAVLFLDLDRFKPINDTMGHAVGDELLKAVAQRLRNAVRRSDTVSRLGGDEFVVVLGGIRGHREATRAAQEILDRIAEPFACDQHEIFSSMSIGIAIYPADGRDAGTLLKSADMAMYVAKQRGRGNYQFYSHQMNQAAQERLELENSLRRALKQQEFSLWYQPQVNLDDGRVTGVEALIRWHHPELGIVPPGLFIPACEEIGLILPLGEWVMRSACRQAKAWTRAGHPPIRMAVNLSLVQFRQSDLAQRVRTIVEETAVDPACIELELTESMIMEDAEATVRIPDRPHKDRPALRHRRRGRPEERGHRRDHHRHCAQPRHRGHRRGRRDGAAARVPSVPRLRRAAGLLLLAARSGRRVDGPPRRVAGACGLLPRRRRLTPRSRQRRASIGAR
ncbi:MAG: diguanylate cyclase [Gammaproteobacteria bacterium]|nr:diguanylate cyclase [Gammaproteobacteria bacterium]